MTRMKIVFYLICVCSSINIQNVQAPCTDFVKTSKKGVSKSLIDDSKLDLNVLNPDTITYVKYAMILYSRILDYKFFNNQYQQGSIFKQLHNFSENNSPEPPQNTVKKLQVLSAAILKKYDFSITTMEEYTKQALYHNALVWLRITLIKYPIIAKGVSEILNNTKRQKAKNYLNDIIAKEQINKFFDFSQEKFKKIDGWREPDFYSEAIAFAIKMVKSNGADAPKVDMICTDLETYEKIFSYANKTPFEAIFGKGPWVMIRIIDHSFHKKSLSTSTIISPYEMAPETDAINLKQLKSGSMPFVKSAAILFYRAFIWKFDLKILPLEIEKNFLIWPTRDEPYLQLRFCSFQYWFSDIVSTMKDILLQNKEKLGDFFTRAYFHRLIVWLRYHVRVGLQDVQCTELTEELVQIFTETESVNILTVLAKETIRERIFQRPENTYTYEKLQQLGEEEDGAASTMFMIALKQMEREKQKLLNDIKSLSQTDNDDETTSKIQEYQSKIKRAETHASSIKIAFGPPANDVLCKRIEVYTQLLRMICEKTIWQIFGTTRLEMYKLVKAELNIPNSDNDEEIIKLLDSPTGGQSDEKYVFPQYATIQYFIGIESADSDEPIEQYDDSE